MADESMYLRRQMDQALIGAQEKHWNKMTEIVERQITIESELTALSTRFVEHIDDERNELKMLHDATERLVDHTVRIDMLERMQYALWGALGTLSFGGVGWVIAHLSIGK